MASEAMALGKTSVLRLNYSDLGGTSDITCPFAPDGWTFFVLPNAEDVFYSFDGATDHGILIHGLSSPSNYGASFTDVWFRRISAAEPGPSIVYSQASKK